MTYYQRPRRTAAAEARRLESDRDAFAAQAAVHRRLMDLLEDELTAAEATNLRLESDVLRGEVERQAGLEREMQSSADHAEMALAALLSKVVG